MSGSGVYDRYFRRRSTHSADQPGHGLCAARGKLWADCFPRRAPEFDSLNPMAAVHGGWYGTLLDSAMACAVMTKVPKGSVYTTLEYKVNLVRPVPLGTPVECIGETDHVGRSTGVAHGRLIGLETGTLYATGSSTCLVMKKA